MRCEVEAHERRNMKYLEAAVEQEDQRMKDAKVVEQPQSVQTQDAPMTSSSSSSSSSASSSSSSSQAGDDVPMAMSATASTDRDSASKRKRGRESEDEEDQARPPPFALCFLQIQDPRSLFTNQNCGIRMTCVRSFCRPESRVAQENGNWLEVGRSTNKL